MNSSENWQKLKETTYYDRKSDFSLDLSRINFDENYLKNSTSLIVKALSEMADLEKGAIANKDENRMVGHYWLRDSSLAPDPKLQNAIERTISDITEFSRDILSGKIVTSNGKKFSSLLIVGIGGSALGPQFIYDALQIAKKTIPTYFFDNTDSDGMAKCLNSIPDLHSTLAVVISKSGGTKETRNGQLIIKEAFRLSGVPFEKNMVAVTGEDSELDNTAKNEGWLKRFPMWDWVGGRTSVLSAVGLLPAALQGFDINNLLSGARHMDQCTREKDLFKNPAMMLALAWLSVGEGVGKKDMVVLPYSDRILLLSRYLQQLIMESLGKELDRSGNHVNQGIAVYGNKGSTDQHAYVQQLRDGVHNFFAVFIEVLKDRSPKTEMNLFSVDKFEVEPNVTSGDYLSGFLQGTKNALYENKRESITITVPEVSEFTVGQLIALFERAVGFYASMINVNAYHQPGVEAGKKAAAKVLAIQSKLLSWLSEQKEPISAEVASVALSEDTETVFRILRHLSANKRIASIRKDSVFEDLYSVN